MRRTPRLDVDYRPRGQPERAWSLLLQSMDVGAREIKTNIIEDDLLPKNRWGMHPTIPSPGDTIRTVRYYVLKGLVLYGEFRATTTKSVGGTHPQTGIKHELEW